MRVLRVLAAATLVAALTAAPTLSVAQSQSAGAAPAPLALRPDGRLPLQGTPWRLVGYTDGDRQRVPGPEVAAFIRFGSRSYLGSGGCSKVEGGYGVIGTALALQPKRRKARDCAENLGLVQQAVESGLRRAGEYALEAGASSAEDQLVIYSVSGTEVLRYGLDHLTPLDGAQWRLTSYTSDGETVAAVAEMPGLLTFQPDTERFYKRRQSGPITATTGCNGLVAEFFRQSDVLSFGPLELTDAPCTDELTAQEEAMTAVLEATSMRLELPADRLVLTSSDTGERLEFASQTPLEGTTWWLERTAADAGTRNQRITLRLEDGIASGDGPCGPVSASYVSDGAFITFMDARGTGGGDCAELRTEQAFISGLRRAVSVERGRDRLEFADADGTVQLTFGRPFGP